MAIWQEMLSKAAAGGYEMLPTAPAGATEMLPTEPAGGNEMLPTGKHEMLPTTLPAGQDILPTALPSAATEKLPRAPSRSKPSVGVGEATLCRAGLEGDTGAAFCVCNTAVAASDNGTCKAGGVRALGCRMGEAKEAEGAGTYEAHGDRTPLGGAT